MSAPNVNSVWHCNMQKVQQATWGENTFQFFVSEWEKSEDHKKCPATDGILQHVIDKLSKLKNWPHRVISVEEYRIEAGHFQTKC